MEFENLTKQQPYTARPSLLFPQERAPCEVQLDIEENMYKPNKESEGNVT